MFIQRSQYLKEIKIVRVSEGRDFDNGLRLDRNEKVINLISDTDKKYKKIIEDNFLGNKIIILIKKEK